MASLFEHLSDTMPFTAALNAGKVRFGNRPLSQWSIAEVKRYFRYLKSDESFEALSPPLPERPAFLFDPEKLTGDSDKTSEWAKEQKLWSWKHTAEEPFKLTDIWCRVRQAGYGSYKVCDVIEWGVETEEAGFKNAVRVTSLNGVTFDLPLTKEYVLQKWVIHAGWIPADATRLWQLEALADKSFVVAFSYDIDSGTGKILPTRAKPEDDQAAATIDMEKQALEQLRGWADDVPDEQPTVSDRGERPPVNEPLPWGLRVTANEDYMRREGANKLLGGVPGDTVTAAAGPARVLVVITITCCRERADFEPGGVVGMARLYPHVMMKASIPLESIRATARFTRPPNTMKKEPWDGWAGHAQDCCLAYDHPHEAIGALLVADENKSFSIGPPQPYWGNLFSGTLTDAFDKIGRRKLHAVRNDRPQRRTISPYLSRDVVLPALGALKAALSPEKMPRQGAFDNIHLAPKLELRRAAKVKVRASFLDSDTYPIKREDFAMTDIVMAPFCAHDCFHFHWRWGEHTGNVKWTLGWDATGPYKAAGAPLVPLNQEVWVWLEGPNVFCYHAIVGEGGDEYFIDDHQWQVILHHGAAIAVSTVGYVQDGLAKLGVWTLAQTDKDGYTFTVLDDQDNMITEAGSSALFYWSLRYKFVRAEHGVTMEPRILFEPGGAEWLMAL